MERAVYKSGSACILPNSNDVDYIYYYETSEERVDALIHNHDRSVDKNFVLWQNRLRVFLGCYIYPFMEHISGEEIPEFKDFNICDHKTEYKEIALRYISVLEDSSKTWYHILIACYMFDRGKNSLTKTQIKKVQEVHDSGITNELKEYCVSILNKIE